MRESRRDHVERHADGRRLEHGVGSHPAPPLRGEDYRQSALVLAVASAAHEPAPLQVLDQDRRARLRQQQVLSDPAQRDAALGRDVVQELALVLAQVGLVGAVERAPDPAICCLKSFSF